VVTWWHGEPPEQIANDFLGVVADRRITDTGQAHDRIAALRQRANDYAPGDTDLAWTRITPWRTLLAGAFDTLDTKVTGATIVAPASDPTAALMSGWLASRVGIRPKLEPTSDFPRMRSVSLQCANGEVLTLAREDSMATFARTGHADRNLPLVRRPTGEELAEELRRLDSDQIYAEALAAYAGVSDLDSRPHKRVHIWKDPVLAARPAVAATAAAGGGSEGGSTDG
jgi:glucose-6-phosphate dehydrogenase assembly protein OpcA